MPEPIFCMSSYSSCGLRRDISELRRFALWWAIVYNNFSFLFSIGFVDVANAVAVVVAVTVNIVLQ